MPRKSTPSDFWRNVSKGRSDECWLWMLSVDDHGYGRCNYHQTEWKSSRLAWFLTYGDPGDLFVLHTCDNPPCCNPSHLFLGTQKDNMQDSSRKGRHPKNEGYYLPSGDEHHSHLRPEVMARGEANGAHVLTEPEVIAIREAYAAGGTSFNRLANQYGVAKGTIIFIVHRMTWKHLK